MAEPRPLRVAVADDDPTTLHHYRQLLTCLGHEVVVTATSGQQLVEGCREAAPDLVITDVKMPELDGIEAAVQINREAPVPVILVSAHHDPDTVARAQADHAMSYLVKPIKLADLEPAIALATSRFAQMLALRQEADRLRQELEDKGPQT